MSLLNEKVACFIHILSPQVVVHTLMTFDIWWRKVRNKRRICWRHLERNANSTGFVDISLIPGTENDVNTEDSDSNGETDESRTTSIFDSSPLREHSLWRAQRMSAYRRNRRLKTFLTFVRITARDWHIVTPVTRKSHACHTDECHSETVPVRRESPVCGA